MYALKWWKESTRMFFDGEGGGSASPPASAPPSGGDGGGAVSAPAPAEGGAAAPSAPDNDGASVAPAPAETPASGEAEANPWGNLGSTDDLDYLNSLVSPTPAKPAVVPPVQPAATPPTQPVVATPPAPAEVPPPTQLQPSDVPVAPPALSPSDPVAIANAIEANRDVVMTHLAQTKFALTPEDITELETDVVAAVPKIMSRVFIEAQVSMQRFLAQAMPGMMKQYSTVTKANDDAETKFFDTHKELDIKNAQHRATAVRIATIYRKANPNISLDQLIAEVGPMVKASLQINGRTPPAAPATPGQPRGGTPFRPAVNGGGGSSPAPAEANEWAGLGQTFDEG